VTDDGGERAFISCHSCKTSNMTYHHLQKNLTRQHDLRSRVNGQQVMRVLSFTHQPSIVLQGSSMEGKQHRRNGMMRFAVRSLDEQKVEQTCAHRSRTFIVAFYMQSTDKGGATCLVELICGGDHSSHHL
jgi:hypothetical protein